MLQQLLVDRNELECGLIRFDILVEIDELLADIGVFWPLLFHGPIDKFFNKEWLLIIGNKLHTSWSNQ